MTNHYDELNLEEFLKFINEEFFFKFEKTSKGQFVLISVESLKLLREKGYDLSIVVKFANDNTVRAISDKNVNLYLSLKKSNMNLLNKFDIKFKDIDFYYKKGLNSKKWVAEKFKFSHIREIKLV